MANKVLINLHNKKKSKMDDRSLLSVQNPIEKPYDYYKIQIGGTVRRKMMVRVRKRLSI